jgi:hypothetical protein
MAENHRRPVTGDLNKIFGGVRFRRFEVCDNDLIDVRLQRGQIGAAILKPRTIEYRVRDVAGLLTG